MERGSDILNNTGTCHGDCLSAILFTVYLANTIEPLPQYTDRTYYKKTYWSESDWMINRDTQ